MKKILVTALVLYTEITGYTDVNKSSNNINKNTEHRITILHLPPLNQCIRQTNHNPEISTLTKKDIVVVWGATNDITRNETMPSYTSQNLLNWENIQKCC